MLLLLSRASFSQVPKPGKPAFIVNYKESGKNANESWSYSGVVKFSLSNWNEPLRGKGYTPEARKLPLDLDPGAILRLEPGQKLTFYPSEVDESGSGSHGSYTRFLGTDGVETITETTDQGTRTLVIDDAGYRKEHGVPTNENFLQNARYYQLDELAELERTETGAILHAYTAIGDNMSEWAVSDEASEQVWPQVTEFVLTDKDIQAWQQISRTNTRSGSYDEDNITITISVKMEVEMAQVTLEGCSELGAGEIGNITASGNPGGGTYEFWVDPSDLMSVDASGASATLTGSRPGRGTLYVEYTTPDGAKAQATKPASMVRIYNYNGGEAIPQIPLYDIDGNKLPGTLTIPYSSEPDEAQELVDFVSGNPSVFTVVASVDNLDLQGVKAGKTTFDARDNCGNTTGPTVEVEVVNCDKETVEALERMREAAMENLQQANEELQRVANSEEFEKARDEIVESTEELAAKTALTIIAAGKTEGAVETAVEIAEAGEAVSEMIGSRNQEEFNERTILATLKAVGTKAVKTLAGVAGVHEAAKKFGENLGQILYHEEVLKSAMENFEKAYKDLEEITRKQQICKGDKTGPQQQEEPKADQTPEPADPTPPTEPVPPVEPTPKTDTPPAKDQPTEEPTAPEPGDEEPPVSPPPPTSEISQVGLPYTPDECGCNSSKGLTVSSEGFEAIGSGLKNLGNCVDKFNTLSLADYQQALQEMSEMSDSLSVAVNSGPSVFQVKAMEAKPRLDSIVQRAKSYDEAGKTFLKQVEKCPDSVSAGMDVLKSANTVTVDSIKTKY